MTRWENAGSHLAGSTFAEWEATLTANPKILWGLIADVVKAIKAGEGERKTGRRPAVTIGSLDELYALLFPPTYMVDDFPQAFRVALGERTQGEFGKQIGMSQAEISRLVTGIKSPSLREMELIAGGLNVRPTYFREYRAGRIGEVVAQVLQSNPMMSADAVRSLVGARR